LKFFCTFPFHFIVFGLLFIRRLLFSIGAHELALLGFSSSALKKASPFGLKNPGMVFPFLHPGGLPGRMVRKFAAAVSPFSVIRRALTPGRSVSYICRGRFLPFARPRYLAGDRNGSGTPA
jgi:hypothetical protein